MMKELRKIRLINWHMFHNRTIEVNGNVLLTGENGTGKSTLLDAIQFVLNAGKAKFNIAANDGAKRKVEGYIRGKLGVEGKEFLRDGDVTSHVALEFYDNVERKYFVIGCVLDLNKFEKLTRHFYAIYNTQIRDNWFVNENKQPKSWRYFKSTLDSQKMKYDDQETLSNAAGLIRQTLGIGKKYNELLPKALAFKPIDSLNKFMFDYLLNKNEINLNTLTDNIHRYREFEKTLEMQKKSFAILERIYNQNEAVIHAENMLNKREYLSDLITYYSFEHNLNLKKNRFDYLSHNLINLEREKTNTKAEYDRIDTEYQELNTALQNNAGYQLRKQLMDRQAELKGQFSSAKVEFSNFSKSLNKEIGYLKQLRYEHDLPNSENEILEDIDISMKLKEISKYAEDRKSALNRNIAIYENKIEVLNEDLNNINKKLNNLRNKKFSYKKEVTSLIDLLKTELKAYYGKDIDVRPFCEFLEINDETWRNAVEGYLNTHRFDIIIEPQYFNRSIELYEQYKEKLGIFGTGIVDVAKLEEYEVTKDNTLASKVDSTNPYAKHYANYLLNKVELEKNVTHLRKHKVAITPTCMLYKNFTVRAINPRVYNKPFIGLSAIEIQLKDYEGRLSNVKDEIMKLKKSKAEFDRYLEILKQSQISTLANTSNNIIHRFKSLKEQLDDIDKRLKEIKKDDSWITLQMQLDEKQIQRNKYFELSQNANSKYDASKNEHSQLEKEVKELSDNIELMREAKVAKEIENILILKDTESLYESLRKRHNNDFEKMKRINDDYILNCKKEIQEEEMNLKSIMHEYNQFTNIGFAESREDLSKYLDKYEKLRTIELDESIRKSEIARKKCQDSFQEDFISKLKALFDETKKEIKNLNNTLSSRQFNGETYEFIINPSENKTFAQYYNIINSGEDFSKSSLFIDELSEKNRQIMLELFNKLALVNDDKNEKVIQEYTDYRKYMSYDIKIHNQDGTCTLFSKVSTEKSGGETQTPYYVTIAASFEQLLKANKCHSSSGCLVLFDEAFNNMDESRIENMMKFYRDLNIQLIIAVPPGRIQTIAPHVETVLTLIKDRNQIYVGEFNHEL